MVEEELESISEICDSLPFMQSFPFRDYSITLQDTPDQSTQDLGIDPILIKTFGHLELSKRVHFSYVEGDSTIMVSFYLDDLKFIDVNQKRITKLDSVREELENGLASNDVDTKIKMIKRGKSFVKKFKSSILDSPSFERILMDLCEIKEAHLATNVMLDLHKLNPNDSLKHGDFSKRDRETIAAYLNFQLHYAKIILGIVIAAKIY